MPCDTHLTDSRDVDLPERNALPGGASLLDVLSGRPHVIAAGLSLALATALLMAAPVGASSADDTPRAGVGVRIDSALTISPSTYTPGQPLAVGISGTLTTTALRDVVCHSLTLTAARGSSPLLTRYASTDRTPQLTGESHTQEVSASLDMEPDDLPASGPITVTVDLQCSPMDAEGSWDVLDAVSQRIASGRIQPASGTVALSTRWLFPDDEEREVRPVTVSVTASAPITISVSRGSKTVWKATSSKAKYQAAIPLARTQQSGTYRVRVTTGGSTTTTDFRVSRGWAPIYDSVAAWPRCSTVTWSYDPAGAPRGGDVGVADDVGAVLKRYAELTGLRFEQVAKGRADIEIGWAPATWEDGQEAAGGASERDGVLASGVLTMFTNSEWSRTPGFGVRGRGSLLYHEIGHILGLGHVSDDRLLMYPVHTFGQSPLVPQKGDIAGLRELYRPQSCR